MCCLITVGLLPGNHFCRNMEKAMALMRRMSGWTDTHEAAMCEWDQLYSHTFTLTRISLFKLVHWAALTVFWGPWTSFSLQSRVSSLHTSAQHTRFQRALRLNMHDCCRCPTWKVKEQQRVWWSDTAEGLKCLFTYTETRMTGNHRLGGRRRKSSENMKRATDSTFIVV